MFLKNPTRVLTNKCRLSYEHLMKAYANKPGKEEKYSVTLLIPKGDTATKADIDQSIQAAIQKGLQDVWGGVMPPSIGLPIHDGDGLRQSGEPFGEECRGHWVMTASSKMKPEVVDLSGAPILQASEVYSGMYARATVNFFAYNSNGNRGIGCGLGNVQKLSDGEPLGGRTTAAEDFGAAPIQQSPAPYTPAHAAPNQYPASMPQQQQSWYTAESQQPYSPPPAAPMQPNQQQVDPITGLPVNNIHGV